MMFIVALTCLKTLTLSCPSWWSGEGADEFVLWKWLAISGAPLIVGRRARHGLRIHLELTWKSDNLNTVLHVLRSLAVELPAGQPVLFRRSQALLILFALAARKEQVLVSRVSLLNGNECYRMISHSGWHSITSSQVHLLICDIFHLSVLFVDLPAAGGKQTETIAVRCISLCGLNR